MRAARDRHRELRLLRGASLKVAVQAVGIVALIVIAFWLGGPLFKGLGKLGLLGEPEYRVVFYFTQTGFLAGLGGSLSSGEIPFHHPVAAQGVALVIAIGLTATLAQIAMTHAYRLGNTLVTANLQYSGIVFSSLLGLLIWHDTLGWMGWTGLTIILLSGVASTFYQQASAPEPESALQAAIDAIPPNEPKKLPAELPATIALEDNTCPIQR